jgi:hypothetical protein
MDSLSNGSTPKKFGQPLKASGNGERIRRYKEKTFTPNGPNRANLGLKIEDFFYGAILSDDAPAMLAWRMARVREDGALTPFGTDAFDVFRSLLVRPEIFVSRTVEQVLVRAFARPLQFSLSYLLDATYRQRLESCNRRRRKCRPKSGTGIGRVGSGFFRIRRERGFEARSLDDLSEN